MKIKNSFGFTLMEVVISLGISGLLGLGTLSLMQYMNRSKETVFSSAAQLDLRSMIFMALRDPATCNQKLLSLASPPNFAALNTPVPGIVPIQILNHSTGAPLISDGQKYQGSTYSVKLSGTFMKQIAANLTKPQTNLFQGNIVLKADRTTIGQVGNSQIGSPTVQQSIPVSIEVATASGSLFACSSSGEDTELSGGVHSIYDCNVSGGTPVIINGTGPNTGRFCLYQPPQFAVDAGTAICQMISNCTLAGPNVCSCGPTSYAIPACPTPPALVGSQVYTVGTATNFYCQYNSLPPSCSPFNPVPAGSEPIVGPYFWCMMGTTAPGPGNGNPVDCGGTLMPNAVHPTSCDIPPGPLTCPRGSTYAGMFSATQAQCNVVASSTFNPTYAKCPTSGGWVQVPGSPYTQGVYPTYTAITCQ